MFRLAIILTVVKLLLLQIRYSKKPEYICRVIETSLKWNGNSSNPSANGISWNITMNSETGIQRMYPIIPIYITHVCSTQKNLRLLDISINSGIVIGLVGAGRFSQMSISFIYKKLKKNDSS